MGSGRANRTDVYPDIPEFDTEEEARIDAFLKKMKEKYGEISAPFRITPFGCTPYKRQQDYKKLVDAEITGGLRRPRKK